MRSSHEEVVSRLAAELSWRGRCLDVGIGAGRLALPMAQAGVAMAGVDISAAALSGFAGRPGPAPFPLAVADAAHLPFADASFGGAVASLVFNQVAEWRRTVTELVRVVRPAGVVVASVVGGAHDAMAALGYPSTATGRDQPAGVRDIGELDRAFEAAGASVRALPSVIEDSPVSPEQIIQHLLEDQPVQAGVEEALRAWATQQFGSLTTPIARQRTILWRAYDLAG